MSFVRTVLGDIPSEEMGLTYSHEHVVIEKGFTTWVNADFTLNDTGKITSELLEFYQYGGRTLVDTMPAASGRNIVKLAEVSGASKVNIIAPTGLHLEIYYPPNHWRYHLSVTELTELFIQDILTGIDQYDYNSPLVKRTSHKAGLLKLATGDEKITPHQQMIFEAVVNAHLQTGAPILTHTNSGRQALEQVALFIKLGADPAHIVLSHMDKNRDLSYHKQLMETGVYVEYDSHFRWKTSAENWTYELLEKLLSSFGDRIVIGMDMARNSYWRSYGGQPGLIFLVTSFKQELEKRGLGEYFEKLFFTNPQRLYTFRETIKK
jgi:predicted metal-dependent phosphotriesterase family hydrolase